MKRIYDDTQLQKCYEGGYDAAINGANTTNSDFSLFTSPNRTKAWKRGNRAAKRNAHKKTQAKS